MEMQTAWRIRSKVQTKAEEADEQKPEYGVCSKSVKAKLGDQRGINYFALGSMKRAMNNIDAHLRIRLRVIIWKQWKVPSKRQWGLQKLGIGKALARVTAYCGDRYQWIVTKTCVVRAISKDAIGGTCDLLRLLHGTPYFEVMLNCHMPNGMYGGVRGERKSPLLDWFVR